MKWNKVGRLTLKKRGELVKWAEEKNLELVRVNDIYRFFEKNGRRSGFILRRCPCGNVEPLIGGWESFQCSKCEKWGEVA